MSRKYDTMDLPPVAGADEVYGDDDGLGRNDPMPYVPSEEDITDACRHFAIADACRLCPELVALIEAARLVPSLAEAVAPFDEYVAKKAEPVYVEVKVEGWNWI